MTLFEARSERPSEARQRLARLCSAQGVRFIVVGLLNTGFSYSVYAALLYLGVPYQVANLGAMLLGVLFSFRTHGRLVFGNSDSRLFFRYVVGWIFIYLMTIGVIALFIFFGANEYWAGLFALPVSALLSYVTLKLFVFQSR